MSEPRFVDVFVEPNANCPEGAVQRWKMEDGPRPVGRVRYWAGNDEAIACAVVGWSSEGGGTPVPAMAVTVEDSGSGTAILVWGSDWGLQLLPEGRGEPFGEAYLMIGPEDVLG